MDDEILKDFEELFDFDISKKQLILNKIISFITYSKRR